MSQDVTPIVRAWLQQTAAGVPDPVGIYADVAASIKRTPVAPHRPTTRGSWPRPGIFVAASLAVLAFALVAIATFLPSVGSGDPAEPVAPAAVTSTASATPVSPSVAVSPPPPRIGFPHQPETVVDFESVLALPGQTLTATASICSGGVCRPAWNPRWVVNSEQYRDLISPPRGDRVRVTAKPKIGGMEIRVKGLWGKDPDGTVIAANHATSVEVRPRPRDATRDWRRRHGGDSSVFPDVQVLRLRQHVVLTGWRCPAANGDGYGADAEPGTTDDDCVVSPITSAGPLPGSGLSFLGTYGPSALLRVDSFVDLGGNLNATGVVVRYDSVTPRELHVPYLYVRNEPWTGPLLGDIDGDRDVDGDDAAAISERIASGSLAPASPASAVGFDLNADRVIDETDRQLVEALSNASFDG